MILRRIMIGILLFFLFTSLIKNFYEYRKNYNFYESYKNNYEKAKKENSELKTEIVKQNDPAELEKTIRNKLDLVKPNETAVIVPLPTPTPIIITPTPLPPYQQWFHLFFQN